MRLRRCYFSLGNHEVGYEKAYGEDDLTEQLEAAGAVVLEKEYVDTKIAGQEVRIGGAYGYLLPRKTGKMDRSNDFWKRLCRRIG